MRDEASHPDLGGAGERRPAHASSATVATLFAASAGAGYVCLVALGIAWWVANLGTTPSYGDTSQYFALADSLQVDQYRTLFYPLLLRALQSIARSRNARAESLLYGLQTAAALLSVAYLGRAFWDVMAATERFAHLSSASSLVRRSAIGAAALVVFSEPLVNHFALSVMTDSLAASFTAAGIAALVRIAVLGDTRLRTAIAGWLSIAAAGFMRAEKVGVFVLVIALTVGIIAVRCRRAAPRMRPRQLRAVAVLALLLVTPSAVVLAVNRATQTADHGWPPLTVSTRLFVRTAWPRLADVRPLLSAEAQAVVSAQDAETFDRRYNEYLTLVPRLRRSAGATDRLVDEISWTALRHRGFDIAAATAVDALRYTAPMLAYPADLVVGARSASAWTDSRMSMAHPGLTRAYLVVATIVLIAIQLPPLLLVFTRGAARDARIRCAAALAIGAAAINGVLYALGNGLQNVRYGLPAYVLVYAVIVWANATLLAATVRAPVRDRCG